MIIFNIVVWSLVSAAWAWLAWYKRETDVPIWPDVMACVGAAGVAITYIVKLVVS
jgi:hypothetical protein